MWCWRGCPRSIKVICVSSNRTGAGRIAEGECLSVTSVLLKLKDPSRVSNDPEPILISYNVTMSKPFVLVLIALVNNVSCPIPNGLRMSKIGHPPGVEHADG